MVIKLADYLLLLCIRIARALCSQLAHRPHSHPTPLPACGGGGEGGARMRTIKSRRQTIRQSLTAHLMIYDGRHNSVPSGLATLMDMVTQRIEGHLVPPVAARHKGIRSGRRLARLSH